MRHIFNSQIPTVRRVSRSIVFVLVAAFVVVVSSAIADELNLGTGAETVQPITQSPASVTGPADSATVEVSQSPSPTPTPTEVAKSPSASPSPIPTLSSSPKASESATAEVSFYLDNQPKFRLVMPASISVDPRATSKYLPNFEFSGSSIVLACLLGSGISLDVGATNQSDDLASGNLLISGDRSSLLRVSGSLSVVKSYLHSGKGVFATSTKGAISGKAVSTSLVALSEPSTDLKYCGGARTSASSVFRALGLSVETKKGAGTLK